MQCHAVNAMPCSQCNAMHPYPCGPMQMRDRVSASPIYRPKDNDTVAIRGPCQPESQRVPTGPSEFHRVPANASSHIRTLRMRMWKDIIRQCPMVCASRTEPELGGRAAFARPQCAGLLFGLRDMWTTVGGWRVLLCLITCHCDCVICHTSHWFLGVKNRVLALFSGTVSFKHTRNMK